MYLMKRLITIATFIFCLTTAIIAATGKIDDNRLSQKAQYVFYHATAERQAGNYDSFFDLIEYAHRLDTTNTAIGFYYGVAILTMDNTNEKSVGRAIDLMRRHVDAVPQDYNESSYYYQACWEMGRWDEAKRIARRQIVMFPEKDEALQRLALCYAREQQYDSVITIYDQLEQRLGVSENITSIKASTHEMMGDSAAALNDWRAFQAHAPLDVNANTMLANAFMQQEQNDSARFYLSRALELDPYDGFANFSMAQYYENIGDSIKYEQAIYRTLTECDLEIDMKLRILQRYSAMRIIEEDSTGRSDALFRRMLELHPMEVELRMLYFSYLSATDRDSEAMEQINICLDLDPTNNELWQRAITLAYLDKDYDRTRELMNRAESINGDDEELMQFIASTYHVMKDYPQALDTYDRMLKNTDPNDFEKQSNIIGGKGDTYIAIGDTITGIETYKKALEINPANVAIMNNYAYTLACEGQELDLALELISRASHADPDNDNYLDTYAWIYHKRGEQVMALFYMESAIKKNENPNAEILEHYGDILAANNRLDDAREQWQKALEKIDPRFDKEELQPRLEKKLGLRQAE